MKKIFKSKKIKKNNNIGEILKNARYKTGLSLKLVAKHINLNAKYLEAMEKGEWHKLPGEIYAKNFLKKYHAFLQSKTQPFKIDYSKIFFSSKPKIEFHKKTFSHDFLNLPHSLKIIILIIISLIAATYIVWQVSQITRAPEILLIYPEQDLALLENSITLVGQTEAEVKLKINNSEIFLDENNNFSHQIDLLPGLNLIKITGKKKYSRTKIIERKIVFDRKP
ncbi:helix-turn-helix domain-containing protein [Patescibacteria group bacterium]|nr:helix-turn-helix domain-containing protein [Patescibacteria group bacterium]